MDWTGLPLPENAPARGTCVRIDRPEPGLVVLTLDPPHRERTVLDVPLWRDLAQAIETVDPRAGNPNPEWRRAAPRSDLSGQNRPFPMPRLVRK